MRREAGYLIRQAADFYGDAIAVTCGWIRRTFREQNSAADSVACAMYRTGVRPGDKIGILGWNSLDLLDAWLGCEKLGAVRVVMHPHLSAAVLRQQMDSLSLKMMFVDQAFAQPLGQPESRAERCPFVVMNAQGSDWGTPFGDFLRASAGDTFDRVRVDDTQPWIVQFTSGTTGYPKPWGKSLRSWIAVIEQSLSVLDRMGHDGPVGQDDVNLHFHTLQSSSGFKTLFPYYIRGARTVLVDPHKLEDPVGDLIATMASEGVTGILLHGSTFRQWVRALRAMPQEHRAPIVARLRRAMTSLVGPDTLDLASEVIGPVWCHTYGSTEQGSPVTALFARDLDTWGGRGTVGRVQVPAGELRIVSPDSGKPLPVGSIGEIEVRGDMSVGRYLAPSGGEPPANAQDWLRVGDLGILDGYGALHFIGRSKDLIRIGAHELSPWQIEQRLLDIVGVEGCAVIRGDAESPALHVLVQPTRPADASLAPKIKEFLGSVIDRDISWALRLVPVIPTAEGGVKVDRQGAMRLLAQKS